MTKSRGASVRYTDRASEPQNGNEVDYTIGRHRPLTKVDIPLLRQHEKLKFSETLAAFQFRRLLWILSKRLPVLS